MRRFGAPVVANVAGEDVADYADLTRRAGQAEGVAAIELNLSCPNVSHGLDFAVAPPRCHEVVAACRAVTDLPLWAKLTPNVGDIASVAKAAEAAGADALVVGNTVLGLAVDWRKGRPKLARGAGGLSGPAIKPIAMRLARVCVEAVKIPVIGCGGILTADDALDFLCIGCRAVQVGTATYRDPFALPRIIDDLGRLLEEAGWASVAAFTGSYKGPIAR